MIQPELFQAVLNLAVELADKGREGKPVGTIFVVGDHEKVMQLSKQMIMNPFKGYEAFLKKLPNDEAGAEYVGICEESSTEERTPYVDALTFSQA